MEICGCDRCGETMKAPGEEVQLDWKVFHVCHKCSMLFFDFKLNWKDHGRPLTTDTVKKKLSSRMRVWG